MKPTAKEMTPTIMQNDSKPEKDKHGRRRKEGGAEGRKRCIQNQSRRQEETLRPDTANCVSLKHQDRLLKTKTGGTYEGKTDVLELRGRRNGEREEEDEVEDEENGVDLQRDMRVTTRLCRWTTCIMF